MAHTGSARGSAHGSARVGDVARVGGCRCEPLWVSGCAQERWREGGDSRAKRAPRQLAKRIIVSERRAANKDETHRTSAGWMASLSPLKFRLRTRNSLTLLHLAAVAQVFLPTFVNNSLPSLQLILSRRCLRTRATSPSRRMAASLLVLCASQAVSLSVESDYAGVQVKAVRAISATSTGFIDHGKDHEQAWTVTSCAVSSVQVIAAGAPTHESGCIHN